MATSPPGPRLRIRAVPMLLIPAAVGLAAGILGYVAYGGIATATLIGGDAIVGTLTVAHALLDRW
jgi:hypothetical protein